MRLLPGPLARRPAIVLLVPGLLAVHAGKQSSRGRAGCYDFGRSDFHWYAVDANTGALTPESTSILRLTTDSVFRTSRFLGFAAASVPPSVDSASRARWSTWQPTERDSLTVTWADGYHALTFRQGGQDTLRGRVARQSDVDIDTATLRRASGPPPRPALAVRIECPQRQAYRRTGVAPAAADSYGSAGSATPAGARPAAAQQTAVRQAAAHTLSLTTTRPRRFVVMNNGVVTVGSSPRGVFKLRRQGTTGSRERSGRRPVRPRRHPKG